MHIEKLTIIIIINYKTRLLIILLVVVLVLFGIDGSARKINYITYSSSRIKVDHVIKIRFTNASLAPQTSRVLS